VSSFRYYRNTERLRFQAVPYIEELEGGAARIGDLDIRREQNGPKKRQLEALLPGGLLDRRNPFESRPLYPSPESLFFSLAKAGAEILWTACLLIPIFSYLGEARPLP